MFQGVHTESHLISLVLLRLHRCSVAARALAARALQAFWVLQCLGTVGDSKPMPGRPRGLPARLLVVSAAFVAGMEHMCHLAQPPGELLRIVVLLPGLVGQSGSTGRQACLLVCPLLPMVVAHTAAVGSGSPLGHEHTSAGRDAGLLSQYRQQHLLLATNRWPSCCRVPVT